MNPRSSSPPLTINTRSPLSNLALLTICLSHSEETDLSECCNAHKPHWKDPPAPRCLAQERPLSRQGRSPASSCAMATGSFQSLWPASNGHKAQTITQQYLLR